MGPHERQIDCGTYRPADSYRAMQDTDRTRKPIVLVVEDEPFIRFTAADYISDAGWQPIEAGNAVEAKAMLKEHPETNVLFTDINLPGTTDGLQLAEFVHREYPNIELVVTSGRLRLTDEELPDAGTFLAKPYLEADLIRVLDQKLR